MILTYFFFISAISGTDAAHSWIIDGDTNINGFYYVHCYWGWSGHSNGYFSTSCFQPNNGVVYDNIGNNSIDNSIYSWHFRLLTYNVPNIVRNESLNIPIESL